MNEQTPRICALTGANGFVGRRLWRHLESEGWRVIPWTRQTGGGGEGVVFRLGEEIDPALLKNVHAVVHCAYDFGPRRWPEIAGVNVEGSRKLFEAARTAGVESIVHISSLSAFPGCRSLYGRAKLATEEAALSAGGLVLRPGLIYGEAPGGMFGRLVAQVKNSKVVPVIRGGRQTQYLVHEQDLGATVLSCLAGRAGTISTPISLAHEQGWELTEILRRIGHMLGRRVTFIPVPWQLAWVGLKSLEIVGVPTQFRSDSLISLVYQDPQPSFALLKSLGFRCRPFQLAPAMLSDEVGG